MEQEPTVTMVSKEKVEELRHLVPKPPTQNEQNFINIFMECGNATQAALRAFNCTTKKSAGVIGARLVKKFSLERFKKVTNGAPLSIVREKSNEDYMDSLEKALTKNKITFEEMYNDVYRIARDDKDSNARLRAYTWLHEKGKEYEDKVLAKEMEEKDVEDLLSEALASVDKKIYISILLKAKSKRTEMMKKRNNPPDAWKIINEERNREKDTSNIINVQEEDMRRESI